ncbi:MAG: family 2 glycosyl transferase [Methanolobus sp. T82-4]|nr:MAG: family 2 glycosyl transferase [Methanolobus sp. T82-4]
MPLISVVIPLYNKELHIKRAINSVLVQTIQDFEIVVVDDGSTDKSSEIVRTINDERIKLIQQENRGVSAARNRGIEKARADIIAFLDSDDEWLPTFLETVIRLRKLFPEAGIYGAAYEVHFRLSKEKRVFENEMGERILPSYFEASVKFGHVLFNSSSFAAPKDILTKVGGYPINAKWNEDGCLWGKIAFQFPIAYSPRVCSIYHKSTENSTAGITDDLKNPFLEYISSIPTNELKRRDDFDYLKEYTDFTRLATISRNIYSGHHSKARKELLLVTSSRYKWKKRKLQIISYIPSFVLKQIKKTQ